MEYASSTAQGSRIASEGDVAIVARSGDLSVIGSRVEGDNVALAAAQDLILKSATETTEQRERNKASSGAIGVTVGSEAGIGVYVSASTAKGQGQGSGTTHAETTVQAGNTLTLISGRDTTLEGAQALGERVIADVGRNLSLISQQDTNDYRRKDQAGGIDAAVGTGGGQVSGYYNQQKIDSTYTRVREQTGIQAGAGGFDIRVGGHTELVGAAIASTADPSLNRLSTGSLSVRDLQNEASYQASSVSMSGGTSGGGAAPGGGTTPWSGGLSPGLGISQKESTSSTTRSGISAGTIEVRNGDTSALASLDRSVTQLQQDGLQAIFDERKVQERLEMGQVAGQVGMRTAGDLADKMGWEEGSKEKAILHGLVGAGIAALGGGEALQGLTGAAANQLATKALQDYLVHDAKIDPDSPEGKTLMELASVAIGTAFGGGSGAATALYGEQFNRQLHPDEFKWIDENAEKFAAQLYGCDQACTPEQIQTAKNRLIIEAGARVDAVMADRAGGVDEAAQAFINTNPVKFAWGEGFTATREQYYDFKYFGDLLSRDKQAFIDLAEALDSAGWDKREFQAAYHDQLLAAADRARGESGQAIIENFTGDVGLVLGIVRKLTEGDTMVRLPTASLQPCLGASAKRLADSARSRRRARTWSRSMARRSATPGSVPKAS